MLFKSGQKVLVRKDLEQGKRYYMEQRRGVNSIVSSMERFIGKIVTIERELGDSVGYTLKEDDMDYTWTDEMLEFSNEVTLKLKNKEEQNIRDYERFSLAYNPRRGGDYYFSSMPLLERSFTPFVDSRLHSFEWRESEE